ncbi:hypothetical protein BJ742DRAFT_886939 [Cladochytrium replicatum]|nr:hypothetical protein BJ742DRAFT_886939 [Cladochytrium replicatum]
MRGYRQESELEDDSPTTTTVNGISVATALGTYTHSNGPDVASRPVARKSIQPKLDEMTSWYNSAGRFPDDVRKAHGSPRHHHQHKHSQDGTYHAAEEPRTASSVSDNGVFIHYFAVPAGNQNHENLLPTTEDSEDGTFMRYFGGYQHDEKEASSTGRTDERRSFPAPTSQYSTLERLRRSHVPSVEDQTPRSRRGSGDYNYVEQQRAHVYRSSETGSFSRYFGGYRFGEDDDDQSTESTYAQQFDHDDRTAGRFNTFNLRDTLERQSRTNTHASESGEEQMFYATSTLSRRRRSADYNFSEDPAFDLNPALRERRGSGDGDRKSVEVVRRDSGYGPATGLGERSARTSVVHKGVVDRLRTMVATDTQAATGPSVAVGLLHLE